MKLRDLEWKPPVYNYPPKTRLLCVVPCAHSCPCSSPSWLQGWMCTKNVKSEPTLHPLVGSRAPQDKKVTDCTPLWISANIGNPVWGIRCRWSHSTPRHHCPLLHISEAHPHSLINYLSKKPTNQPTQQAKTLKAVSKLGSSRELALPKSQSVLSHNSPSSPRLVTKDVSHLLSMGNSYHRSGLGANQHPGMDKMQTPFHFYYTTSALQLVKQKVIIELTLCQCTQDAPSLIIPALCYHRTSLSQTNIQMVK